MPDRDFISRTVPAPFRKAARLWVGEGPSEATLGAISEALAKALRDGGETVAHARRSAASQTWLDDIDRESLAIRILVRQAVFAPVRGRRLIIADAEQVHQSEQAVLQGLAADIARYARQVAGGKKPIVRRRPRPSPADVLTRPVQVQL